MASGTTAQMRCGTKATWQGRGWPTRGAGGAQSADTWHKAMWLLVRAPHGIVGVGSWRAHGLGGPTNMIGAITQ